LTLLPPSLWLDSQIAIDSGFSARMTALSLRFAVFYYFPASLKAPQQMNRQKAYNGARIAVNFSPIQY